MTRPFSCKIRVDWGDCDPAGIVFYPNFYRWMDRGFWLLLESKGLTLEILRSRYKSLGGPLVDTGARFISPARPGDNLTVNIQIKHWGEKSFRVEYRFSRQALPIAHGFEVRVWGILQQDGSIKSGSIPKEVRDLFPDDHQDRVSKDRKV